MKINDKNQIKTATYKIISTVKHDNNNKRQFKTTLIL